jgi:hypothetical protein
MRGAGARKDEASTVSRKARGPGNALPQHHRKRNGQANTPTQPIDWPLAAVVSAAAQEDDVQRTPLGGLMRATPRAG